MSGEDGRCIPHLWDVEPPRAPEWSREDVAWIVSRHADVASVLASDAFVCGEASSELRRVANRVSLDAGDLLLFLETMMPMQNGAPHRASRGAVATLMARVMVRWPRARLDELATRFVDDLHAGHSVDVVASFVDAFSQAVAADVFGMEAEAVRHVVNGAYDVANSWRPLVPIREIARLAPIAHEARKTLESRPRAEHRIPLEIEPPQSLSGVEFFLLGAGTVTSSNTLAAALSILAQNPNLQQVLRSRTNLVEGFVSEALRYAGAVRRLTRRLATLGVSIGGVAVPAGSAIILDIERAGRDPQAYREPEVFDIARDGSGTLAFGGGSHACMGPRLARNQIASAILALLSRFTIAPAGEPAIGRSPDVRRFLSLPLRLEALSS